MSRATIITDNALAPEELAALARLKYVTDDRPGLARARAGRGFVYRHFRGTRVTRSVVARIESLAIPPAWTDVWICPQANGHLQATGQDEKRRKQYLYHPRWREISNLVKFRKLIPFGRALPLLRARIRKHTRARTLTREKVAALLVDLLDCTAIRIGNEEYVRNNNSFGLSTLRKRHVSVKGSTIEFRFRAKGGQPFEVKLKNLRLARIVAQCLETPGSRLFKFMNEAGKFEAIDSSGVNQFLQQIAGEVFTAKDFRMWKATTIAAEYLYQNREVRTRTKRQALVREAVKAAATALANTPTVCRNFYIHPTLLESFDDGRFQKAAHGIRLKKCKWLKDDEQLTLKLLEKLPSRRR